MDRIDQLLESYQDEMVQTLRELVRIPSVDGEPKEGMPFGENCAKVLDYALKKDKSGLVPKYYVFFRAKDAASLNAAFTEYSNTVTKEKKPSVLQKLRSLIARAPVLNQNRERQKERGQER